MGDFNSAAFGDLELSDLAEAIDEDKQGEGAQAFEAMIALVGLKGGSVVKLKRRLFEHGSGQAAGKGGGSGGGGGGKGKCNGKGGKPSSGASASDGKAKGQAPKPKPKSKDFVLPSDTAKPKKK